MLVAGIMKKDVVTISPMATVREALMTMKERGVRSLVVEKRHSGDAYGLIAYRDVATAVIAEDGDIDLPHVYDLAQKPALQVSQPLKSRYSCVSETGPCSRGRNWLAWLSIRAGSSPRRSPRRC